MKPLRAMVVDDELPGRQRLESLLAHAPGVDRVESHGNPLEAVEAIRIDPPDLIFLDVQMPEMTGIEVVQRVGPEHMPATVFVTAYDRYALRAFELAALDYLLKPFDDDRFEQALARARERLRLRDVDVLAQQLRTVLGVAGREVPPTVRAGAPRYLERVAVEAQGQRLLIPAEEIDYIAAEGPYAELHVGNNSYLLRERMHVLEQGLDPGRFCRIHRSTIVNVERITALEPLFQGDHLVKLRDGTRLKLSRTRREELAQRLGIPI